ncbi:hypothetical protein PEX1_069780 [Penicillium expansum]|uniref:Dynamin n=1 Tax=Penicillium expansum TaxID=27334 RepID=A0A0A2IPA7_PENEN|nr:hypothetical protein PEX2_077140 [Penicillium expansum]KGO42065.1 hypothetical protein PEXP_050150 [Penicillium expansum]KGO56107.1 hypothetical protein PEX2_077140 [Penicillium expansum]KGO65281.1 hypothetical protein PEX1_069780 [Penicillium expansum]
MSVPSSEFTFSASPRSTVIFTPPSSSRDSSNEGNIPSTPQSTRQTLLLFQDLSLNDSAGSINTPRARSPTAWLSPGSSPSTYAQQHNATPRARRNLVPYSRSSQNSGGSRSIFSSTTSSYVDAREERTESMISDGGTDRIHIPGAFPAQSSRGESHVSDDANESEDGSESDQYSDTAEGTEDLPSDIHDEPLPGAPVYNHRLQTGLKEVKGELASLASMMGLSELKQDQSTDLHSLYERTKKMSMFECPETRIVGFIGDSGVGKSSLINSLLDQNSLSRSSSEGAACTCVVTEFRHVDSNHTGPFTIEAQFMTAQEMKELLDELLSSFRRFHVTSSFQELKSQEEQHSCRDAADRAWETFRSLFSTQPRLTMEFLSADFDGAYPELLEQLERWAYAGLTLRPGGPDALEHSVIAGDLTECKESLDLLTANNMNDGRPALWPFIKLIRVYLKSPILNTGLILADLPGFSDLNFARVRATERYLAHSCDEVFVVADISRACTNPSIQDVMRRCRDDQPRRVILSKSEVISPEESGRGTTPDALQIRRMNKEIQAIQKQIKLTEVRLRKVSGAKQAELAVKGYELRDKENELTFQIKQFLITRRNNLVAQELTRKHTDIRVFCISNTFYSEYRRNGNSQAEAYVDLSGIRELRRYCQLVPAESQLRLASAFLEHQVPALLRSIRQWALSGTDSVTAEKSAILRRVLENTREALRREFISSQSYIHLARQSLDDVFTERITEVIRNSRARWTTQSIEISLEWAGWAPNTYAAFCRKSGDYKTGAQSYRCWNNELVQPAREALNAEWEDILDWLQAQTGRLVGDTRTTFEELREEIEAHIELAPHALQNLQQGMKSRQECIEDDIQDSIQKMIHNFEYDVQDIDNLKLDSNWLPRLIKRDMLYGHASSFISGLMQPAYAAMNREEGGGSDSRRKKIMNDHLTHSRLFAEFSNLARSEYTNVVTGCFNALQESVTEQIESLVRDFHAVVTVEGQASEAEQAPALAEALRSRFGRIEEILQSTMSVLQERRRG